MWRRTSLAIYFLTGAGFVAGCASAAISLAPLAIQAVEAVGSGATNAASNASAARSGERGDDEVDRQERCDTLEDAAPMVIEFRRPQDASATQWRELRLDTSAGDPSWVVAVVEGSVMDWHRSENLPNMKFVPPLAPAIKPGKPSFLAYAPAEPQTGTEDDELTSMTAEFGAAEGTFQWNGRVYQYATSHALPCFPAPPEEK